jgi:hypothetical protein
MKIDNVVMDAPHPCIEFLERPRHHSIIIANASTWEKPPVGQATALVQVGGRPKAPLVMSQPLCRGNGAAPNSTVDSGHLSRRYSGGGGVGAGGQVMKRVATLVVVFAVIGVAVGTGFTAYAARSSAVSLAAVVVPTAPRYAKPTVALREVVPAGANQMAAADFNGDGLVDVLVARLGPVSTATLPVTLLLNKGKGRFVDATKTVFLGAPPRTQHPRQIVIADFNRDGRPDAFIADHGSDQQPFPGYPNTLILSRPGGKLVDASVNLPRIPDFSHSAAAGDVDGNGTIDLYVGDLSSGCEGCAAVAPEVLLNDGAGHFAPASDALPAEVAAPFSPHYNGSALVDVNGDGALDLVLAAASNAFFPPVVSLVLFGDRRGHFVIANELPPKPFGPSANSLGMSFGDLNGDHRPDLVLANAPTDASLTGAWLQVLINNGDGSFRDETAARLPGQRPNNTNHWIPFPQLIDLNGDGQLDLLTHLTDPDPGVAAPAFLNDGHGNFKPLNVPALKNGMYAFVNDKPRQPPRDVLAVSDAGALEVSSFYRRTN